MRSEVYWYPRAVDEVGAWADDRVPAGVFTTAVPAAEATERRGGKSNAWLFYCQTSPRVEEQEERAEHHGRRDRAYLDAGFAAKPRKAKHRKKSVKPRLVVGRRPRP